LLLLLARSTQPLRFKHASRHRYLALSRTTQRAHEPLFRYQNYITWVPGKVSKMGEVGPTFIVKNILPSFVYLERFLWMGLQIYSRYFNKLMPIMQATAQDWQFHCTRTEAALV
jgi:hypothetical protein